MKLSSCKIPIFFFNLVGNRRESLFSRKKQFSIVARILVEHREKQTVVVDSCASVATRIIRRKKRKRKTFRGVCVCVYNDSPDFTYTWYKSWAADQIVLFIVQVIGGDCLIESARLPTSTFSCSIFLPPIIRVNGKSFRCDNFFLMFFFASVTLMLAVFRQVG